jgi:hypothetical protein
MTKKLTLEDCRQTAKERGGGCLSLEYYSDPVKMLWQCKMGHKWEATYNSIRHKSWCPECNGYRKITLDECMALAEKHGGKDGLDVFRGAHLECRFYPYKGFKNMVSILFEQRKKINR